MNKFICKTCGTMFPLSDVPPASCPICEDERQYVGWGGQAWTTMELLGREYSIRFEDDDGLLSFGLSPDFAINQRALLLPTQSGNIMWECLPLVTEEAIQHLRAIGEVSAIVISHPHFYSAMAEWSHALGNVPIFIHEADREWVQQGSENIVYWKGDSFSLSSGVTILRMGGHFEGSAALHWQDDACPQGALFPGDAIQVVMDRNQATFMYSYPNYIPMRKSDVERIRDVIAPFEFNNIHGFTWGRNMVGQAKAKVDQSLRRFLQMYGS